uniref:Uncharacterized protein n=1 Tax=Acrobeloides nanus TaxID=290746 RepID=A0A914EMF7_9BILA
MYKYTCREEQNTCIVKWSHNGDIIKRHCSIGESGCGKTGDLHYCRCEKNYCNDAKLRYELDSSGTNIITSHMFVLMLIVLAYFYY